MKMNKWGYAEALLGLIVLVLVSACSPAEQTYVPPSTEAVDGVTYMYWRGTDGGVVICSDGRLEPAISTETAGALRVPSVLGGEAVKSIGSAAFIRCQELTSVVIPEGVEVIGHSAFAGCGSLTSVTIPDGVKLIRDYAFDGCNSLTSIVIPNSVTNICYAFGDWLGNRTPIWIYPRLTKDVAEGPGLQEIIVEAGNPMYSSVDGVLFDYAGKRLKTYPYGRRGAYVVPDGVKAIGEMAFRGCDGLTSVSIPASVEHIASAFSCSNLTSVVMAEGIRFIGSRAFSGCSSLSSVNIPKSVEKIDQYAFSRCPNLTSIPVHPENPHYVSIDGVLYTKDGLELVAYPGGRQGAYAIPDGVKKVDIWSFKGAAELTALTIPASVKLSGYSLDFECSNLASITVDPGNPNHSSIDGVLFDKTGTRLLVYPAGKQGAYSIPAHVTSIENGAFLNCKGLTEFTIPASVTTIKEYAFHGCSALTTVTIPDNVKTIEEFAFADCTSLTNVVLPNTLNVITNGLFMGCSSLPAINIPKSVKMIGYRAFCNCTNLLDVTFPPDIPAITYQVFGGCSSLRSFKVPQRVRNIEEHAFINCTSLTEMTIPNSVTNVGWLAFSGCPNITSVTVPKCVKNLQWTFPHSYDKITNVVGRVAKKK